MNRAGAHGDDKRSDTGSRSAPAVAYVPILYRFVFGEGDADMARLLQASASAWTVLRPPRLTDGPATGRYRTALNEPLRRAGKISRADLALAMLDALDNARTLKAILTVAY